MSMARVEGLRIGDRYDIEQLMYKYCKAADMADVDTQADLFHEDCRVRYSGTAWIEGREALRASLRNAFTRYLQTSHAVTNITIEFQDTDYAKESTNLAKAQIISQAATAMLAQANQSGQSVLALLK